MISSEKNKDLWIEDYIKRVKVLSAQEIKLLETLVGQVKIIK